MGAHLHAANLVLDKLAVEIGVGTPRSGVELERDGYLRHQRLKLSAFHTAVSIEKVVTQRKKGDGAIHGTCVYIDVADAAGQVFGHGALAAGRIAVDGYCYLFHYNV